MFDLEEVNNVFQSYGRCCAIEEFFEDFYNDFFNANDEIKAMFVNTDMQKQHFLLRNGLLWLIMYARGASDNKLRYLANSHNREGYNVKPHLYSTWVQSLLNTIAKHDPAYTEDLAQEWRNVLQPGINILIEAY